MAYGTTAPVTYIVVDSIMDFIFMTDVGLNFLTGEVQYLSICCRCVGVCVLLGPRHEFPCYSTSTKLSFSLQVILVRTVRR
jgi:hypothetical protein